MNEYMVGGVVAVVVIVLLAVGAYRLWKAGAVKKAQDMFEAEKAKVEAKIDEVKAVAGETIDKLKDL